MKLRLFCALPVPIVIQGELANKGNSLRNALPGGSISWTKAGKFHLTLSFLGDVEQSRIDDLASQLKRVGEETTPFETQCRGLGCFPNLNRPRVIWVGVQSDDSELVLLQGKVAAACAPFMERQETKPFNGHITLGRIRHITTSARAKLEQEIELGRHTDFGRWTAQEMELLASDLSQGSPIYTILHHIHLGRVHV